MPDVHCILLTFNNGLFLDFEYLDVFDRLIKEHG